jgi:hypothetical protein
MSISMKLGVSQLMTACLSRSEAKVASFP